MEEAGDGAGELVEEVGIYGQEQRQGRSDHDDNGEAGEAVAEEAPSPMETGAPPERGNDDAGATGDVLVQPTLFSYIANDLVWARAGTKGNDPFWPVRSLHFSSLPTFFFFFFHPRAPFPSTTSQNPTTTTFGGGRAQSTQTRAPSSLSGPILTHASAKRRDALSPRAKRDTFSPPSSFQAPGSGADPRGF